MDYLIEDKPLSAYPQDVIRDIKLISINKNKLSVPVGSFTFRAQPHPADIDLRETFTDCCSAAEVAAKFERKIKQIVKNILTKKIHFITDFKAGLDKRFNFLFYKIENGVGEFDKEGIDQIEEICRKKLMSEANCDILINLIQKKKLTSHETSNVINIFRKYLILRWTPKEILHGYKILPGNVKKYLKDALMDDTIVKLDMVSLINNKLIEVSNFFVLVWEKNGKMHYINPSTSNEKFENVLKDEIETYYFNDEDYNPFKMCKRIYSLSRLNHDIATIEKIFPLLSGGISLLYQIRSEISSIIIILDEYRNPSPRTIFKQIDNMKNRLTNVSELDTKLLNEFIYYINFANNLKNNRKKIISLMEIHDNLSRIINYYTITYLNKIGLNPPPAYLLSNDQTYDKSIVRQPNDNPQFEISGGDVGAIGKKLFQTAANLYRKTFCQGKSRPLLPGEFHYACHNYTGPGTRIDLPEVRSYPPYNDIDACSRQHDIDYYENQGNPVAIRKADEDVIKCYAKYPNENGYNVGMLGINGKMVLENLFPDLIKSIAPKFSGKGCLICEGAGCDDCSGPNCIGCGGSYNFGYYINEANPNYFRG